MFIDIISSLKIVSRQIIVYICIVLYPW